ncbi:hypothetical protein Lal_00021591 [Lupinus albus]|uniref:Putative transcription factor MYB-HB-like family n=1 Tax=Lupinus albus TaxID=3870 RepID=A0A6A4NT04_LUPAL|nr:putative transcription factor MYB-HB-like family [Lupinus albus]KAF1860547.1 hypothetical protein Lal_00021591 [Lupinus albus]
MDFDPSFLDKLYDLPGVFSEHTRTSKIPIMVPLQQNSTLLPPPPNNIFLYNHDNSNNFQHHHHHSFNMIQTNSSTTDSYANWSHRNLVNSYYSTEFAPNNNKMEGMHGYFNTCKGLWDFPRETPIQHGAISQPRVGPSLPPPPPPPHVYESMLVNYRPQDKLAHITGAGNGHQKTDQNIVIGDDKGKRKMGHGNNVQIVHKITNTIKGHWTPHEDMVLMESVRRYGIKKWSYIAQLLNGRVAKQCRERWLNHLRPNIRKDSWSEEEDKILIEAHKDIGNKWAKIAKRLSGRTENTVKNHWNATKRRLNAKRRVNKRIDPKGELLLNYIKQVTTETIAKKELKKPITNINLRSDNHNDLNLHPVSYENNVADLKLHYAPAINENDCYVPVMEDI